MKYLKTFEGYKDDALELNHQINKNGIVKHFIYNKNPITITVSGNYIRNKYVFNNQNLRFSYKFGDIVSYENNYYICKRFRLTL